MFTLVATWLMPKLSSNKHEQATIAPKVAVAVSRTRATETKNRERFFSGLKLKKRRNCWPHKELGDSLWLHQTARFVNIGKNHSKVTKEAIP
jgi:hypothetical protein